MDGMREWLTRAALTWDELVKGWMPMLTTSGVIAHHFKRAKSITKGAALLLGLSARPALLPASSPDHGKRRVPSHVAASLPRHMATRPRLASGSRNAVLSALKPHHE
jgi:hypothetical protein